MKGIWRVFRYEFGRQIRRRGYLAISIGVPIAAILIFFAIKTISAAQANDNPGVVTPEPESDLKVPRGVNIPGVSSGSPLAQTKPAGFVDLSGLIKTENGLGVRFKTEEEAHTALVKGDISTFYLIAADYLQTGRVIQYIDKFNLGALGSSNMRLILVQNLANAAAQPIQPMIVQRLQDRYPVVNNNMVSDGGETQQSNEDVNFVLVYVFSLALIFSAFTTSGYLMQSVVEEKETRMVEVLLSSVRPRDLLAGKFLALSLLGMAQMVLWLGTLAFLTGEIFASMPQLVGAVPTANQLIVVFLYYVLGYLFFGASYAAIGAMATNMREGPQLAVIVTLPAALPFYALTLIASAPSGPLAIGLSLFPLTSPLTMVMRAALIEIPLGELLISVGLLILTIALTIWFAGRVFRVGILLSGRVPNLRDLVKLVRERG